MRQVDRQALVPFSAQQMFDLVDDVAGYPAFLPWCRQATVHERTAAEVVATLQIHKGALHTRFTTRNSLDPPGSIRLALVEGPFKALAGEWKFEPIADKGSRVSLSLRLTFRSAERTLTDAEVESAMTKIVDGLRRAHSAERR